ncbi:MAG: hypothetical protein LC106_08240 [Burkholderiales bacterium]|nr:hypothetical protein [Burkholderiales bacterium]
MSLYEGTVIARRNIKENIMITFFDVETIDETYESMKEILEGKSQKDVWKFAVMYAENYIHTKQQEEMAKRIGDIDINQIFSMATEMVKGRMDGSQTGTK